MHNTVKIYMCVYVYVYGHASAIAHMWRSEDNLWVLVLCCHHVGLRDQTQVLGSGHESCYPLSDLASPSIHD